ncbi:Outer dense fiber protein 3 [Fasciola gigantica]|uniref:Outer dense fiber protein 3 n=1 Tax=Fasciola gigantica TaxID=46835 RepID=A0A504YMT6_FASGI|nr:Outer dense fiber protein 3 [Fasciola gigantica]
MTELGYPYTKPRGPIGAMITSPGPIYMLPPLIGEKNHDLRSTHVKAPAYSLGKQLNEIYHERSPGPAAYAQNGKYTNVGEATMPKYTITGIQKELKRGQAPGPSDYNVETGKKLVYPVSPAYPMGLRLAGRRTDDTPAYSPSAPNAYTLPNPAKRSEVRSAPNYTMAGRNDANMLVLNKVYSHLPSVPKFTMGIKHSPYKGEFALKYDDEF